MKKWNDQQQTINSKVIPEILKKDPRSLSNKELLEFIPHIESLKKDMRVVDEVIKSELNKRYGMKAEELLNQKGPLEYGTVYIKDGTYDIKVTKPKKILWDQMKLEQFRNNCGKEGKDYVKAEFSLLETVYLNAPDHIRGALSEARTIEAGPTKYEILKKE